MIKPSLTEARARLGTLAAPQRSDAFAQEGLARAYDAASPAAQSEIRAAIETYWDEGTPAEQFLAHEFMRTVDIAPDFLEQLAAKTDPRADAILAEHRYKLSTSALHVVLAAFLVDPLGRLSLAPIASLAERQLGLSDEALPAILAATVNVDDLAILRRAFEAFVAPEREAEFLSVLGQRSPKLLASLKATLSSRYQ